MPVIKKPKPREDKINYSCRIERRVAELIKCYAFWANASDGDVIGSVMTNEINTNPEFQADLQSVRQQMAAKRKKPAPTPQKTKSGSAAAAA